MLDHYDQLELLALIEGDAASSDAKATALRQRLAKDPRAAAMIERMRADRVALRSLGDPALPVDFIARLEPVLARQMLTEPLVEDGHFIDPNDLRRQHRYQHWRLRWGRLAAAAVVFLTLTLSIWVLMTGRLRPSPSGDQLAFNEPPPRATLEHESLNSAPDALHGPIHHALPALAEVRVARQPRESSATIAAVSQPIVAEFAIAFNASVHADIESALSRSLTSIHADGVVVRNFSYTEARQIAEEWRVAHGGRTERTSEPMTAGTGGSVQRPSAAEMRTLAERVRQSNLVSRAGATSDRSTSGVVAGSAEYAPSLEQQLELSSQGATHTIAVRAVELRVMLEHLALQEGHHTALVTMPRSGAASGESTLATWLVDAAHVRRAYEHIAHLPPQTVVIVPVVVR